MFRWVENKRVATRLIDIWENIKKVYAFWESMPKSKRPSSKSYFNVQESLDDELIIAKLQFFVYVAGIVEPFLTAFQSDKPMIPYFYFYLKSIIKQLLGIIVEPKIIDSCKTGKQLKDIDLSDKKNLLSLEKMNLGFAVEHTIKSLKRLDAVSNLQVNEFKKSAQIFIISMLTKLFERSPMTSILLKSASIFDPMILHDLSKEKILSKWKMLLKCLIDLGVLSRQRCDEATLQFNQFYSEIMNKYQKDFEEFSQESCRLDEFYFHKIGVAKYQDVAFVIRLLLTLSHGQAAVERGFSHNNALLKVNMNPETVISKRVIKDHMLAHNLKPYSIDISPAMVKSFKAAHSKYQLYLEEEKKKKISNELENKAMYLSNDIQKLKVQVENMKKAISRMNDEAFDCMEKAEKKGDMSYVLMGNRLKRDSDKMKGDKDKLERDINELELKRKKLMT